MLPLLAEWHPFIVHFAVAFTIGSAVFDALDFLRERPSFRQTGFLLMIAALPFLLAAVFTGNLAEGLAALPEKRLVIEQHRDYANIAVWTFTAAGVWRVFLHLKGRYTGMRRIVYVFIVCAAAMSVFLAARKGGSIRHPGYTPGPVVEQIAQPVDQDAHPRISSSRPFEETATFRSIVSHPTF